jgi:hypothetical protein
MNDPVAVAAEATRKLRASSGFRALPLAEQQGLDRDLRRLESALSRDRYAIILEDELPIPAGLLPPGARPDNAPAAPPEATIKGPPSQPPPAPGPVSQIGRQTAEAVAAIDFPGFVAGLVHGVFQAIVDATAQQVREYAALVASLSRSVEDFTAENVTPNQARDVLVGKHGQDLRLVIPAPGRNEQPRVAVRPDREGTRPAWLAQYGLEGEELSDELVEGPLLEKARSRAGEERLQSLATLVLMGINRIVVNDGEIKAKLQFHAQARERTSAEMLQGSQGMQQGIASRSQQMQQGATMVVSTSSANAQADASIRADLVGEVRVSFRTETFSLNNFADTQAIQLINRHARWQGDAPAAANVPGPAAPNVPGPAAPNVPGPMATRPPGAT